MEVTYQELLNDLYLEDQDKKFKDYDVKKALLESHEISPEKFEELKDKYWERKTIYFGVLNFDRLRKLYLEKKHLKHNYFEITFTADHRGDSFRLDTREDHYFKDELSCYHIELFKKIICDSSKIWLVKGNKDIIEGEYAPGNYNIMMLKRKNIFDEEEFTYFDIVEDPGAKKIDLSKYKK